MRNNQPVYDQEYTLHDEQYLISARMRAAHHLRQPGVR